jgi:MoxR-like ATPase
MNAKNVPSWLIYTGVGDPHDGISRLPKPPPWRDFSGGPAVSTPAGTCGNVHDAQSYLPAPSAVEQVNAALYLRRPLLVTGAPGTGKSTLAYAIAHELQLGPVLHWPITSRVTLRDGLYQYDPLTRLYAASQQGPGRTDGGEDIGRFIRLGPLGTALLPYSRPRVLLIDEIDKGDIDLVNDLLTVFEKGEYEIGELVRQEIETAEVMTADGSDRVTITRGVVRCRAFPVVIMTSNGEREFPPAFLRRCITAQLSQPATEEQLAEIVQAHLGDLASQSGDLISHFFDRKTSGALATDQLLNAIYLTHHASITGIVDRVTLADNVMPYLSGPLPDTDFIEALDDH